MADADPMAAETGHLLVVEVDAVGEPHTLAQPAAFLEIVDRPAAEMGEAGSFSSRVSPRWVWRRQPKRSARPAESTMSRLLTVNGAHGASATCSMAPAEGS